MVSHKILINNIYKAHVVYVEITGIVNKVQPP